MHKNFLWGGGTPKIAHHTIIANNKDGGIKYKDLNSFILAINVKFIQYLSINPQSGHLTLPNHWLKKMLKIPTSENEDLYFQDYFVNKLNVLDCMMKVPRKIHYTGHPYYYKILKTYEQLSGRRACLTIQNIVSIPIWFNKCLNTKFDSEISGAGFNFIKDLLPYNQPLDNYNGLRQVKARKLRNILQRIPQVWLDKVTQSNDFYTIVIPHQTVNLKGCDVYLQNVSADKIYDFLIMNKTRPPAGLLRWRETIDMSDAEIFTAFTFAQICSSSTFDQAFQYKIITQILPTNKYLTRYQVKDSEICSKCELEPDTVEHCLWSCNLIVPYLEKVANFLRTECNLNEDISMIPYLFGFKENNGLNHILLELKKELFYNWNVNVEVDTFCERFLSKLRKLMVKEKQIMLEKNIFHKYLEKWNQFRNIYDFLGPDCQIIF